MVAFNAGSAIGFTWEITGLVWLAGLVFTKRTVRSQPSGTRLFHIALGALGFALLGGHWFRQGWLGMRFVAPLHAFTVAGLVFTVAGCAFAIWARLTLGSNWSGRVTVKEGHELITWGPYGLTRHPIYTGLMTAVVGTALAGGEWRCVVAIVVILLALMVKMGQEEKLMLQTFPLAYPEYRQRVKALIPGIF